MQLRMSPGGRMPNSRRSTPEEPPSSVTVTIAERRRIDHVPTLPTYFFSPRSSVESPVPPPIATMSRPCFTARSLLLLQLGQDELGDRFEGVEHAGAVHGDRLERRLALEVELTIHFARVDGGREVALVELHDVGDRLQVVALLFEVLVEIRERLDVRLHARFLR